MYVYCLFCRTVRTQAIAADIEMITGCMCVSPRVVQNKWVRGVLTQQEHDWLPGYVFLYADSPLDLFGLKREIDGIIRCIGNADDGYLLTGADLQYARMLKGKNGILGQVSLAAEGDRVRLTDPVWQDMQGTVTKLDRNRKRCCVAFDFDGQQRSVWVGYEMVENVDA